MLVSAGARVPRSPSQRQAVRALVILGVLGVLGLSFGVFLFADGGDLGDLLIVLGSFVLPLAVVAYVVYRWQLRPPRANHLRLSTSPSRLRAGESIDVSLEILDPRKIGDRLELGLEGIEFYEDSDTEGGRYVNQRHQHEEWRWASRAQTVQRHRFTLPDAAPPSFRDKREGFLWRVSAREPRQRRFDRRVEQEVVVE